MDVSAFFSRLIQAPKATTVSTAQNDLKDFESTWEAIRDVLEEPDERQLIRGISATPVPALLGDLVDALVHESNYVGDGATGPCLEYMLEHELLDELVRLSEPDQPHGIKEEVVKACNNMVVLLSERFLVQRAVHRPLRRLIGLCVGVIGGEETVPVRKYGAAGMVRNGGRRGEGDDLLEENLVDLMCVLCSRMRAYPPLLRVFFRGSAIPDTPKPTDEDIDPFDAVESKGPTGPRFQFDLFSYLLRYVHREGRTGDFARAGLLFLFDIAFLDLDEVDPNQSFAHPSPGAGSDPLEEVRDALGGHILDGDFPQVMAAGLGAIWSLLPNKLRVPELAVAHARGRTESPEPPDGELQLSLSTNENVQAQIDLLIRLFGFLQDIIHRCLSSADRGGPDDSSVSNTRELGTAISEAVLRAIRSSFLENVLYPSILECSSTDGSAVAVVTYLDVLLSHLDDGPLLDGVLDFVFGRTDPTSTASPASGVDRFTLKDLVVSNLRARDSGAQTAALRLLSTLVQQHEQAATTEIFSLLPTSHSAPARPFFPSELERYSTMYSRLDSDGPAIEHSIGFASYLVDINSLLQAHYTFSGPRQSGNIARHILQPSDPMLLLILTNLSGFFQHPIDVNIALTGVVIALAMSSNLSLAGLLLNADEYIAHQRAQGTNRESEVGHQDSALTKRTTKPPKDDARPPVIYTIISALTSQVAVFRSSTEGFDRLLSERRYSLLSTETSEEAISSALDYEAFRATSPPPLPARPGSPLSRKSKTSTFGGMLSLFTPKKRSATSATASTPERPATPERAWTPAVKERAMATPSKPNRMAEGGRTFTVLPVSLSQLDTSSRGDPPALAPSTPNRTPSNRSDSLIDTEATPSRSISRSTQQVPDEDGDGPAQVPLSRILDNCVILEEFLKEIVAVIMARQALGIDAVVY